MSSKSGAKQQSLMRFSPAVSASYAKLSGISEIGGLYIKTSPKRGYQLVAAIDEITPVTSESTQTKAAEGTALPGEKSPVVGSINDLISGLRHRNIVKVGIVYAIVASMVMQLAELMFPRLLLPDWILTFVVILALLGFPIALVLAWASKASSEETATALQGGSAPLGKRGFHMLTISALVVAVAFLTYHLLNRSFSRSTADAVGAAQSDDEGQSLSQNLALVPIQANTIAVLPFSNMSQQPGDDYLSDGLAEEILTRLSDLPELNVAARTSSFLYKTNKASIQTIGQQLRVRHVLEGSVRRAADQVRITVKLVDAETGIYIWQSSHNKTMEDVISLQIEIAHRVVDGLELILSQQSRERLARRPTSNVDAYDYYLQARDYRRKPSTKPNLAAAEQLFNRALALDPTFAEAFAGLCSTHLSQYIHTKAMEEFRHAERACQRAVALDNNSATVHIAFGNLHRRQGNYIEAEKALRTAMMLNPNSVEAFVRLAQTLAGQQEIDKAENFFRQGY